MNSRFYLRKELIALLLKVIDAYPPEWKEKLLYNRRRPRAKGKPVVFLEEWAKKEGRPEKFKVFEERYKKEIKKNKNKARGTK